jgi:bacterioferritin
MNFLVNIEELRARARKQIEDRAVRGNYKLDRDRVVAILNAALATEIGCVLRYRFP